MLITSVSINWTALRNNSQAFRLNSLVFLSCDINIQNVKHSLKIKVAKLQHTLSANLPFLKTHVEGNT